MTTAHDISRHIVAAGFAPGYTINPAADGFRVELLIGSPRRPIDTAVGAEEFAAAHLPTLTGVLSDRYTVTQSGPATLTVTARCR